MRRQAWWGGVVAAFMLSCAGTGSVEPVAEEELIGEEEQTPTVEAAPVDPETVVGPAAPVLMPERGYVSSEPLLPGEIDSVTTTDSPAAPQNMYVPPFPSETATPVVKDSAGWTFLTSANGLPPRIYGASADEAGNIWVAGGSSGIYVLRAGTTQFIAAGGSAPAISIAGGAAGVAYVGYMGVNNCDMAWWEPGGTADVYKSGDADRLTLSGTTVTRQHYDIYSGPGIVSYAPQGREKLCNIFRLSYHAGTRSIWFGGNHGVAWGNADNTQVIEHTHPSLNGYMRKADGTLHYTMLSGDYMGLAVTANGDVWIGGRERSVLFRYATLGNNFWKADLEVDATKIDVWPDAVPQDPRPEQAVWDDTHGFAPMADGSVWVGSSTKGIAYLNASRKPVAHFVAPLIDASVTAMAADPANNSVWAGHGGVRGKGGLTRLVGTTFNHYAAGALGKWATSKVSDIQVQGAGPGGKRRVIVSFFNGAVGIYDGE